MSEINDQNPPLDPEQAQFDAVDTAVEEAVGQDTEPQGEETQPESPPESKPVWDKERQKFQQETANFRKEMRAYLNELKSARSAPAQQTAADELAQLLEESKKFDELIPGFSEHQGKILAKVREAMSVREELPKVLERQETDAFFSNYPPEFRTQYANHLETIKAEVEDQTGRPPSDDYLRGAMRSWISDWNRKKTAGAKPAAKGGAPVVPAPRARRASGHADPDDMAKKGYVPDGKGGFRLGNRLGI